MPCNTCVSARMRPVAIIDQGVLVRSANSVIQPALAVGVMPRQRWNPPPKRRHGDSANACGRGNDAPTLGSTTQAPTRGDPAKACGQAATAEKQGTFSRVHPVSVTEHVEKVVDENSEAWSSWVKAGQYNYEVWFKVWVRDWRCRWRRSIMPCSMAWMRCIFVTRPSRYRVQESMVGPRPSLIWRRSPPPEKQ